MPMDTREIGLSLDSQQGDEFSLPAGGFQAAVERAEKQLLTSALKACNGNKSAAAAALGMKPSTFRDKLNKYGIA